ncbi:hypothetical protein CHELA17_63250 [Chelatococcus asaccharovorans]|nr:hypothetical protein CHELA17_63250 [Chelatococcus asaccharovorans]
MPRPTMRDGLRRPIFTPSNSIASAPIGARRLRQLKSVVFPAPFGPMIPKISPLPTSKLTSFSATIPPKRTVRPLTRRITERETSSPAALAGSRSADIELAISLAITAERDQVRPGTVRGVANALKALG